MVGFTHTNCPQCFRPLNWQCRCHACGWSKPPEPPPPVRSRESYVGGIDLGQLQDHSAIILAKRTEEKPGESRLDVVSMHRFALMTPYTQIVEKVAGWMRKEPWDKAPLAIDQTGVGVAVVEMFEAAKIPGGIVPITITAGRSATIQPGGGWHVAKIELVSRLQALLSRRALGVPASLPLASVLNTELKSFKAKVTAAGNETFEADWRTRAHDDLCLALGLAAWLAERYSGEMNFHHVRLDQPPRPLEELEDIRFPQIRYFAQSNKFQPMPTPRGELIACCPDFRTQEEAALFVHRLHEVLKVPSPITEIEIDETSRQRVLRMADEFVRNNNIRPQ